MTCWSFRLHQVRYGRRYDEERFCCVWKAWCWGFHPEWTSENCIQCNKCLRLSSRLYPSVRSRRWRSGKDLKTRHWDESSEAYGRYAFPRIQVSIPDCVGCGNCADVCPGNKNGEQLAMVPFTHDEHQIGNWNYLLVKNVKTKQHLVDIKSNVKTSQFAQPLFESPPELCRWWRDALRQVSFSCSATAKWLPTLQVAPSIYSAPVPSTHIQPTNRGKVPIRQLIVRRFPCEFIFGYGTLATRRCANVLPSSGTTLWLKSTYQQSSRLRTGTDWCQEQRWRI